MVELNHFTVTSINFENRADEGTELQLNNELKYNVNYKPNSNLCYGLLDFAVRDVNMQPFEVRIQLIAEFTYGEEEKEDIHIMSFDQLFPFIRQIINNVTSFSGMQPLMVPYMRLKRENVECGENGRNNNPNDDEGMLN